MTNENFKKDENKEKSSKYFPTFSINPETLRMVFVTLMNRGKISEAIKNELEKEGNKVEGIFARVFQFFLVRFLNREVDTVEELGKLLDGNSYSALGKVKSIESRNIKYAVVAEKVDCENLIYAFRDAKVVAKRNNKIDIKSSISSNDTDYSENNEKNINKSSDDKKLFSISEKEEKKNENKKDHSNGKKNNTKINNAKNDNLSNKDNIKNSSIKKGEDTKKSEDSDSNNNYKNSIKKFNNKRNPISNSISKIENSSLNSNSFISSDLPLFPLKTSMLVGLLNTGNTCYINAVLQNLSSIPKIFNYFLNADNQLSLYKNKEETPLSYVLSRLISHLYPKEIKYFKPEYNPITFIQIMRELFPFYAEKKVKDPVYFLILLLDRLNKELNIKKLVQNNNLINFPNHIVEEKNYKIMKENNSIISKSFTWANKKIKKCKCGEVTKNFENYFTFDLDIENTSKYIANNYINRNKNNITIFDSLEYFNKEKCYCEYCKKCKSFTNQTINKKIYFPSDNLIFVSKHNYNEKKVKPKILFEEKINIDKFVDEEINNRHFDFELNGLVAYDNNLKKYIAYCKSPIDGSWIYYNDNIAEKTSINSVIFNKGNDASILFYKKA